jgi:hypothetical protein
MAHCREEDRHNPRIPGGAYSHHPAQKITQPFSSSNYRGQDKRSQKWYEEHLYHGYQPSISVNTT